MKARLGVFLTAAALAVAAFSGMATAQTPAGVRAERLLSVVGEGTVRGRPDMALITAGVVSEAASAREALAENSAAVARIVAALRGEGLASRDLQTSNFSVEPVYSQPPPGFDNMTPFEPKIVGYRVRNELTLRIRQLERTGPLLDQVIALGANSVGGPSFTVSDPTPLEDQARRAAMRDALRKGELYANVAGLALGPVFSIDESVTQYQPPMPLGAMAREMAADQAAAAPPIEGGELAFQARVSVSWQLRN